MALFTTFDQFWQDLGRKVHNLNTDTLNLMLSNTAPSQATDTVKADITEIAAGHGYSAGGSAVAGTTWSQVGGTATLTGTSVVITASGGSFGPFQYAVVYNDTASGDPLIGFVDHGASITITAGESYTFDIDAINGMLQIAG